MKNDCSIVVISLIAVFGIFTLCGGCAKTISVETPPKSIFIDKSGGYVFIEGRWKKTESTKTFETMPKVNYSKIICIKETMTCEETIACLWMPDENKIGHKSHLLMDKNNYKIIEWSGDKIVAIIQARSADIEIKISLKDKFVEQSYRETTSRGNETSDPNVYEHWVLE